MAVCAMIINLKSANKLFVPHVVFTQTWITAGGMFCAANFNSFRNPF